MYDELLTNTYFYTHISLQYVNPFTFIYMNYEKFKIYLPAKTDAWKHWYKELLLNVQVI
jgi:hypothetical protein